MARLEGRVARYPARGPAGWRFVLDDLAPGGDYDGPAVMAYVRDMRGASYGDRVSMLCELSEPFNYAVPGNLDWRNYLAEKGIYAEARCVSLKMLEKAPFPLGAAAGLRNRTLAVFERNFSPEHASVLAGMVLGEKKNVPEELKSAFQDSGAMHLLVASGSNVGSVTFLVYFICAGLGIKKRRAGAAAAACSGFYVLAAGLEAPLVRGYLMFSAALAGHLLDRDSGAFQGLVIACFAILLSDRRALFDAGFQMSFVASYGIIVGTALWDPMLPFGGTRLYLARAVLVSFFAQAGLYPLMALYFHKISLISVISNVVLVPVSGAIMGLGFASLLASWHPLLFQAARTMTECVLGGFLALLKVFASLRYSAVPVSPPSVPVLVSLLVLALALLHAPLLGFRRARLYALAVVPVLVIAAAGAFPPGSLVAAFSDRDTASVVLRAGGRALFLFNPGISGRKLANAALFYGSGEIEAAFISTLDRSDWSGLGELAGLVKIRKVLLPYGALPPELASTLERMSAAGASVERVWPGERLCFGETEVRPEWPAHGEGARFIAAGYSGRGRREGLDWSVTAAGYGISVREGGSRVRVVRAGESPRLVRSEPGKTVELAL